MAKIFLKASCGCGKTFTDMKEAMKHADKEEHNLNVLGSIRYEPTEETEKREK
jgi:hypothetical protein